VQEMGYVPLCIHAAGEAKHIFSHIEWHMTGFIIDIAPPADPEEDSRPGTEGAVFFAGVKELEERWSLPSAFSRYMEAVKRAD